MATEPLNIRVSEKGGRIVVRTLDDVAKSGQKAERSTNLLRNALGTFVTLAALNQLKNIVDVYTDIQNRLKLVTTGTEQLTAVTK